MNSLVRERFTLRIHTINREIEDIYAKVKQRSEERVIEELEGNAKAFYTYANSFRKSKTGLVHSNQVDHITVENRKWQTS